MDKNILDVQSFEENVPLKTTLPLQWGLRPVGPLFISHVCYDDMMIKLLN